MTDIVETLHWLSSPGGEHMDDGPRLTEFCRAAREAAAEIERLRAGHSTTMDKWQNTLKFNGELIATIEGLRERLEWAAAQLGANGLAAQAFHARAALAKEKKDGR